MSQIAKVVNVEFFKRNDSNHFASVDLILCSTNNIPISSLGLKITQTVRFILAGYREFYTVSPIAQSVKCRYYLNSLASCNYKVHSNQEVLFSHILYLVNFSPYISLNNFVVGEFKKASLPIYSFVGNV